MNNDLLNNIIRFIFLVALQVLLLDHIQFGGFINPYLYILFILLLPFETPKAILLLLAFLLGFTIDIFSNTYGLHAAATVFMAFWRPSILKSISARQEYEPGMRPVLSDLGFMWVFFYSFILISIHHCFLFFIEVFSFRDFWFTFGRSVFSILFTLLLVMLSQYFFFKKKK